MDRKNNDNNNGYGYGGGWNSKSPREKGETDKQCEKEAYAHQGNVGYNSYSIGGFAREANNANEFNGFNNATSSNPSNQFTWGGNLNNNKNKK
jgi:hypothetical protein